MPLLVAFRTQSGASAFAALVVGRTGALHRCDRAVVSAISRASPIFYTTSLVTETAQTAGHEGAQAHRTTVGTSSVSPRRRAAMVQSFLLGSRARSIAATDRRSTCCCGSRFHSFFLDLRNPKRPQYILPLMAPVALLVARIWRNARIGSRAAAIVLLVFGLALVIAPPFSTCAPNTATPLVSPRCRSASRLSSAARWRSCAIATSSSCAHHPHHCHPAGRESDDARHRRAPFRGRVDGATRPIVTPQTELVGIEAFTAR